MPKEWFYLFAKYINPTITKNGLNIFFINKEKHLVFSIRIRKYPCKIM